MLSSECLIRDTQIVAATAYCYIQAYIHNQDQSLLFSHFLNLLNDNSYERCKLYLCNGIIRLNSKYFTEQSIEISDVRNHVITKLIQTVVPECRKLNCTTYLAFDTLNLILNTIQQANYPISSDFLKPLLHIVTANLENPTPGVRQKTLSIFGHLLNVFDKEWEIVLAKTINNVVGNQDFVSDNQPFLKLVLTHLPWTFKSKYYLLGPIINHYKPAVSMVYILI